MPTSFSSCWLQGTLFWGSEVNCRFIKKEWAQTCQVYAILQETKSQCFSFVLTTSAWISHRHLRLSRFQRKSWPSFLCCFTDVFLNSVFKPLSIPLFIPVTGSPCCQLFFSHPTSKESPSPTSPPRKMILNLSPSLHFSSVHPSVRLH